MDAFWSGLLGVIIGALVAVATQLLSLKGQRDESLRQSKEEREQRNRTAVAKLVSVVAHDVATFRGKIAPLVEDAAGLSLAEALGAVRYEIGIANDEMRAYSALVPNSKVREAAAGVYQAWSTYSTRMSDDIVNATKKSHEEISVRASSSAPEAFFSAVEEYLTQIE